MVVSLKSRLESNREQEGGWGAYAEVVVLEELARPPVAHLEVSNLVQFSGFRAEGLGFRV